MDAKSVLAVIIALLLGAGGGYWYGMTKVDEVNQQLTAMTQQRDQAQQNALHLSKVNQDAVKKWGNELSKLIVVALPPATVPPAAAAPAAAGTPAAAPPTADTAKMVDAARAILATRDGFRTTLDNTRAAMDSDFDALATELGNPKMDPIKVQQLLQSLQQDWPAKQKDLESAVHALLASLGILPPEIPAAAAMPAVAAPVATPAAPAP